jgi:hypothetical protein
MVDSLKYFYHDEKTDRRLSTTNYSQELFSQIKNYCSNKNYINDIIYIIDE